MKCALFRCRYLLLAIMLPIASLGAKEITAEMVLGNYRADPLFGQALPGQTVAVMIEPDKLVPAMVMVTSGKIIRLLITNQTQQPHLMVLTTDVEKVLANESYLLSFHDEEKMRSASVGTHSHTTNTSVENSSPILKTAAEDPALYISPGATKEMLVKVISDAQIDLYCVLDEHHESGYHTKLVHN